MGWLSELYLRVYKFIIEIHKEYVNFFLLFCVVNDGSGTA
jgi:hypothetical protein